MTILYIRISSLIHLLSLLTSPPSPSPPLSNPYLSFFLPPDFSSVRWVPSGPLSVIAFLNSMLVALRVANREKIFPTHRGGGRRVNRLSGRKKRGGEKGSILPLLCSSFFSSSTYFVIYSSSSSSSTFFSPLSTSSSSNPLFLSHLLYIKKRKKKKEKGILLLVSFFSAPHY